MNPSLPILPADVTAETLRRNLSLYFTPGRINDERLLATIRRLDLAYRRYLALYPYGLWAPGLVVAPDMRRTTDLLLPVDQVHSAFRCFSRCAHRLAPSSDIPLFHSATSWLDLMPRLPNGLRILNPARLLQRAACQEDFRLALLFALHLPAHHGGSFRRYPQQTAFIRRWLGSCPVAARSGIRCLDAACGTGEGTYELAMLLNDSGIPHDRWQVHGMSRDALEIFAAAHSSFPHDMVREESFRNMTVPLVGDGPWSNVTFGVGDITAPAGAAQHDLIVCNGILGGPFLYECGDVRAVVGLLAKQLVPGGILLVADKFHEGWKRKVSKSFLRQLFVQHELTVVEAGEGVGGIKKRQPERLPLSC